MTRTVKRARVVPERDAGLYRGGTLALRVDRKTTVADGVCSLRLASLDGRRLPDWTPGAHIDVTFASGLTRQYSLCGDRWDAFGYDIAVLEESDSRGVSRYVHHELREGDMVGVGAPRNNFVMTPAERYVFVAGGIGITPLLPMIVQADVVGADWNLLYGGRSRRSMAFLDVLAQWGERVEVRPQDEYGHLDLPSTLDQEGPGSKVYCCGPAPLIDAVTRACAGRPRGSLRVERFVAKDQGEVVRQTPFEVVLARTGATVVVGPDVSVLDALAEAGVPLLASCRQGTCGTCETTVLGGVPDHRDSLLSNDERSRSSSFYPCVSRSLTDRLEIVA